MPEVSSGKIMTRSFGPLIPEAEALKTEALIVSSVIEISVCVSVCVSVRPLEIRVFDLGT